MTTAYYERRRKEHQERIARGEYKHVIYLQTQAKVWDYYDNLIETPVRIYVYKISPLVEEAKEFLVSQGLAYIEKEKTIEFTQLNWQEDKALLRKIEDYDEYLLNKSKKYN